MTGMWYRGPLEVERGSFPAEAVVTEMAGRDSVAAAIAFLEGERADLVPTFARTGTEYGGEEADRENLRLLVSLAERRGARVLEPVGLVDHRWWWATVGRPNSVLSQLFGPWHLCVGCHMYLHALRVAFCLRAGMARVVSGERKLHGGRLKINQVPEAIGAYRRVAEEFGVEMILPLYDVDDEGELKRLVGPGWGEGERQWGCVLTGNYLDERGLPGFRQEDLENYLELYLIPVTLSILESITMEKEPDHLSIVWKVLTGIIRKRG